MNHTAPIVHDDPIARNVHEAMEAEGRLRNAFRRPDELSILTAHNYPEPSLLERNLQYLGISNVHVINRPVKVWSNSLRVRWFVEYLERECEYSVCPGPRRKRRRSSGLSTVGARPVS